MYINTAQVISGVPSSWPGYDLGVGSSGEKVRQLQTQLNRIARNYPFAVTVGGEDGLPYPGPGQVVGENCVHQVVNIPGLASAVWVDA